MAKKHVVALLGAALVVGSAAFASSAVSADADGVTTRTKNLPYWYRGESDARCQQLAQEGSRHLREVPPKVKVTVVIQSTDTLTLQLQIASQTKSGRTSRRSGRRATLTPA
jgi:hypothetical protein